MSNTTRFNEELVSLVRSGKLAIDCMNSEDSEKLVAYIFPNDIPLSAKAKRFYVYANDEAHWVWTKHPNNLPGRPVQDFFLSAVSDGEDERGILIEDLKDFDFYILNYREHTATAINFADDNQYKGYAFHKTNLGWSINPCKMGKGYVTNMGDELDFTKSFAVAIDVADQTK